MNGHSSRLSRRKRSRHRDAVSQSSDREEEEEKTARRSLKRRTARAAVNKIKLLEASLSDDCEEENPRRSSGRLRSSRRTAVIQSSSESEGASAHGRQPWPTVGHSGGVGGAKIHDQRVFFDRFRRLLVQNCQGNIFILAV